MGRESPPGIFFGKHVQAYGSRALRCLSARIAVAEPSACRFLDQGATSGIGDGGSLRGAVEEQQTGEFAPWTLRRGYSSENKGSEEIHELQRDRNNH